MNSSSSPLPPSVPKRWLTSQHGWPTTTARCCTSLNWSQGDAPTGEDLLQIALARAYLKWSTISARDEHPLSYVRRIIINETSGAAPAGDASSRWELPDMTPVGAHMVFDEANRLNFTVGSPASGGPIDASFAFMACDLFGQCWFSTARYADPIDFFLPNRT